MNFSRTILIIIVLSIIILFASCDDDNNFNSVAEFPDPIDSVATDITLLIGPNDGGTQPDTVILPTEGIYTYNPDPSDDLSIFQIHAKADGFYTKIYSLAESATFNIDLDAIPQISYGMTGVIYSIEPFSQGCYLSNHEITVTREGRSTSKNYMTDDQGRFGFVNYYNGELIITFELAGVSSNYTLNNSSSTDYYELQYLEPVVVLAPNIYLYPEEETNINVTVSFPEDGKIIESEPEYNNGWSVSVTPDGIIDNEYDYLFYEALIANYTNIKSGFVFAKDNLESEFRNMLTQYGCNQHEIDDFVEFWVPRLDYADYFAFYPQDVEQMITLNIEPQPENLLRILFLIKGFDYKIELEPYQIPNDFNRTGYTAVEWGGIELK